jgi:hypothetical protein
VSLRPANEVTVEEWRLYIATVVGRARLAQFGGRQVTLVAGQPTLIAENYKSEVLFVSIEPLTGVLGNTILLGGDPNISASSSPAFQFDTVGATTTQVILASERLFAVSQITVNALVVQVVA